MADFNQAVALTLQHEGGYVNNPADPGGATNMGITQADMPGTPIKDLTAAQATQYYADHYWKPLYSQITSQRVANKLFDMGVLFGVGTAVKALQTALDLVVDGVFGPMTLGAANRANEMLMLDAFKSELHAHVLAIVAARPASSVFLKGWQTRIDS